MSELSDWAGLNTEWQFKEKDFLLMKPLDGKNALAVVLYPDVEKVCVGWVKDNVLVDKSNKRYCRTALETYTSATTFLNEKANDEFIKAQRMFKEFLIEKKDLLICVKSIRRFQCAKVKQSS